MLIPVILAGGSGYRLWPLSKPSYPKPFLRLFSEHSLLQETLQRVYGLSLEKPIVVCNEEHRFIAAEQLRQIFQNELPRILLEPCVRDTAPAVALAAFLSSNQDRSDPVLLILPADNRIADNDVFHQTVRKLLPYVEQGFIGILGIAPQYAATGYGYVHIGDEVVDSVNFVQQFVEKPGSVAAQHYLDSGKYYWNSGIYLVKASTYLSALLQYRPDVFHVCKKASLKFDRDLDFVRVDRSVFSDCPSVSIDYAISEPLTAQKANALVMSVLDAGWTDVGEWQSLADVLIADSNDNVTLRSNGNIDSCAALHESTSCLVSLGDRDVVTLGVENLIIVDTPECLLVANKEKSQNIKRIAQDYDLKSKNHNKILKVVYRPWGKYEIISCGVGYQVKRITVNIGGRLSLQRHAYRAEYWVVVSGVARVTKGDDVFDVKENESTFIAVGEIHCLENRGTKILEIIEVQSGSYLAEDDIERFNDVYGRE